MIRAIATHHLARFNFPRVSLVDRGLFQGFSFPVRNLIRVCRVSHFTCGKRLEKNRGAEKFFASTRIKSFHASFRTDYTLSFGITSERYATPINNTTTERRDFVSNTPVPAFREQKVIVKNSRIFVLPLDIRSAVKNCSSSARG